MKPGDLKIYRCTAVRKPEKGELYWDNVDMPVIRSPMDFASIKSPILVEVPVEVPEGAIDASILFFTKRGMKAGEDVEIPLRTPVKKWQWLYRDCGMICLTQAKFTEEQARDLYIDVLYAVPETEVSE